MFYRLIENKRNEWFDSVDCTVREFIQYIINTGQMRDAQLEAIKTYLFLKIKCGNRPMWQLFAEGAFNDMDFDFESTNMRGVGTHEYQCTKNNPAAMALMQYALMKNKNGDFNSPALAEIVCRNCDTIDFNTTIRNIFSDEDYADYVYSLPMGAGKTFLMAAFIYIDLYFAQLEPASKIWAHNFMVFAPNGLKTSIIASLRNILEFNPAWIIPEPAASNIKRMINFEILDEQKSAKNSNLVKNPNAQKIAQYQPYENMMGLVAITNAEKVILNRVDKDVNDLNAFKNEKAWQEAKVANELRDVIGKIPNLAIFVDEVHHVVDTDNKLKQVIEKWTETQTFNAMVGFSGTPYLKSPNKICLDNETTIKSSDMPNIVYYYPLVDGIDNFLKRPTIEESELSDDEILKRGVRDFLGKYKDATYTYDDGRTRVAKVAIYCRTIENLEENVFPVVSSIVTEFGLNPEETILRYHQGNDNYNEPAGARENFSLLDSSESKKRIVLLVQIGSEGWDCKSLTGVILPYKDKTTRNSILQRSCRCLRQAVKGEKESALIWLNKENAEYLDKQLQEQQNSSLAELKNAKGNPKNLIERYSRMGHQHVPDIEYYQLEFNRVEKVVENKPDTEAQLLSQDLLIKAKLFQRITKDITTQTIGTQQDYETKDTPTTFNAWLHLILKESFHTLQKGELMPYEKQLHDIFDKITIVHDGVTMLNHEYDQDAIREKIRRAFITEYEIELTREEIEHNACILYIKHDKKAMHTDGLIDKIEAESSASIYPSQNIVKEIVDADRNVFKMTEEELQMIKSVQATGGDEMAKSLRNLLASKKISEECKHKDSTYQYLPYHFDSKLEQQFFEDIVSVVEKQHLEIYYNGDENLTSFIIKCYRKSGNRWTPIQNYIPDFLLLSRKEDGNIDKILILETKGDIYADSFKDKRIFMDEFTKMNNEHFAYPKFDFLYLQADKNNKNLNDLEIQTTQRINEFFNK